MKCQICPRPTKPNSLLCRFHYFALKRLVGRFEAWQTAVEVEWEEYLKQVNANPLSGTWVREVIAWLKASGKSESDLRGMVTRARPAPQDP